jgi:hypothetical protein
MHQILVWQLSQDFKILFQSLVCDLGSITCCDTLTLTLQGNDQSIVFESNVSGCQVANLQTALQLLIDGQKKSVSFLNSLVVSIDSFDHILLEIKKDDTVFCYQLIDLQTIKGWSKQLELLHVLMEENEMEKKNRGKGCC